MQSGTHTAERTVPNKKEPKTSLISDRNRGGRIGAAMAESLAMGYEGQNG